MSSPPAQPQVSSAAAPAPDRPAPGPPAQPHGFVFEAVRPAHLRPWVEEIWYSQGRLEDRWERVLPSATADLVVNLGSAMRLAEGRGDERIVGATMGGLLLRPILLHHPQVHEAVGLRLSPLGLRALLGVPAGAVVDATEKVDDVLPDRRCRLAADLVERCAAAGGRGADRPRAVLDTVVAWATRQLRRHGDAVDPLVRWSVERIVASGGDLAVAGLHRASGYGATRFTARFRDELGLTPKTLARLVRFRRALDGLTPGRDLADLAHDLGLADQSHLNREVRAFAGLTPGELLAGERYPSGYTLPASG